MQGTCDPMPNESSNTAVDRYRARIERVVDILAATNGEKMTLADLANTAAMSPFHFHRVFRALTGETVGAVTRRFRRHSDGGPSGLI